MIYLKTSIGIELRGEDMVISSLESHFSTGTFTHFKRILNYRIRDREEVRREIRLFFKSNRLSRENIVLGIPRKDVVLRYLDFPSEVSDNLKQVVHYQVQAFEPTEEERYYYDYVLLGGNSGEKGIRVLLVMVKKGLLDEYLQTILDLGIRPARVLVGSVGLSNLFLRSRKGIQEKTFILADLSPSAFEVIALHHGALVYSREMPKESGQSWRDLILREVDEAASRTRLGSNDTLEKIVLAGEASESAQEEIRSEIPDSELLKGSVPFQVPAENAPHLQEAASSLGLAFTGIARRPPLKMNLLPPELRIHQTRWAYAPSVLLGAVILALLFGIGFHGAIQNQKLSRNLDQELKKLEGPVAEVRSLKNQGDELEKRIKTLEELLGQRDRNLEILRDLATILPSDTYLNSYIYRNGKVQMGGLSGSSSDLIPNLEQSPALKDVTTRGSISRDPRTGKDRFMFEAQLEK